MTTSADENVGVSTLQEHASHLMAVADAVHESNHQRKEKLDVLMNEDLHLVPSYHGEFDDSMVYASQQRTLSRIRRPQQIQKRM
jgi:hypothetical protein